MENPHVIPAEDGLYPGVLDLHYHQWDACSQSRLKIFDRSGAHFREYRDNPPQHSSTKQENLDLGSAFHMATLQPDIFDQWFVPRPAGHPNSNNYKAAVEEIVASRPFVRILKQDTLDTARWMADAVHAHPYAAGLLEGRTPELSGVWTDPEHGIRHKVRLDDVSEAIRSITDLKSTNDARPDSFGKDAFNFGYWIQAAYYLRVARALGLDVEHFWIIAVEKTRPFGIVCYPVPDHLIRAGENKLDELIPAYARCQREDRWPGYPPDPMPLELPGWAMRKIEHYLPEYREEEVYTA